MTIVVNVDDLPLEQVTKQLNKLINVLKIVELEPDASVERELLLVKVKADAATRGQVLEVVQLFRAQVVDVATDAGDDRGDRLARQAQRAAARARAVRHPRARPVRHRRARPRQPVDDRPRVAQHRRASTGAAPGHCGYPPPVSSRLPFPRADAQPHKEYSRGRDVLRRRRRPVDHPGAQRRRARLRQPGATRTRCPCATPASTSASACSRAPRAGPRPRPRACGCSPRRRPSRRPT